MDYPRPADGAEREYSRAARALYRRARRPGRRRPYGDRPGMLLVTPLQMATVAQTIGNGGGCMELRHRREGRRSRRAHRTLFDGERHAAQHSLRARDELPARMPVGDDRRDRRQVVERLVLVERRADEVAELVLMIRKAKQSHSSERSRRAERRDRTRRRTTLVLDEAAFPCVISESRCVGTAIRLGRPWSQERG